MDSSSLHTYYTNIFETEGPEMFRALALQAFRYQYRHNKIYHEFCNALRKNENNVQQLSDIPYIPVELFKHHSLVSGTGIPELVFKSSGTTGSQHSFHYVLHKALYHESLSRSFTRFFGPPSGYSFLALLPGYMERNDSSLIYMMQELMKQSSQEKNGFFLDADGPLTEALSYNIKHRIKTLFIGVSFSLLDFAEKNPLALPGISIMETGGMKGRRKEMTREELHQVLCQAFSVPRIYSEYGMTELLSQAYCMQEDVFESPPWMKISIREINDPLTEAADGRTGGINIIDLANIHSCCFISTQDLGKKKGPNTFEILGRFDNSDIRGCNLLVV